MGCYSSCPNNWDNPCCQIILSTFNFKEASFSDNEHHVHSLYILYFGGTCVLSREALNSVLYTCSKQVKTTVLDAG